MKKTFKELKKAINGFLLSNCIGKDFCGITNNSKKVKKGYIFAAIKGMKMDGHEFLDEAITKGAVAVLSEREKIRDICWIRCKNVRKKMAEISNFLYNYPSEKLFTFGITGTNGKTTTLFLIDKILNEADIKTGFVSTILNKTPEKKFQANLTTPESPEIFELMHKTIAEGGKSFIVEVSSHSIDFHRIDGIKFDVAIFTNLSEDHLDFYGDMETYFKAKLKLFTHHRPEISLINIDDPYGKRIFKTIDGKKFSFGYGKEADFKIENVKGSKNGIEFNILNGKNKYKIKSKLTGNYNAYNITASFVASILAGVDPVKAAKGIEKFNGVKGRMELISKFKNGYIFIDFAHTPAGLHELIKSVRENFKGRRIVVLFGAGGNRDREKRSKMGEIVSELSDFSIITSDNPRDEDPEEIIKDILKGVKGKNFKVIVDRKDAILFGIRNFKEGDILILAGKGHENYQIIGKSKIPFKERDIVLNFLKEEKNLENK